MKNQKLREATDRVLNHSAIGMALGALLAIGLMLGNTTKVYPLVVGAYGAVAGPLSLIVGCAVMIGVGAAITGYIFDEVDRS